MSSKQERALAQIALDLPPTTSLLGDTTMSAEAAVPAQAPNSPGVAPQPQETAPMQHWTSQYSSSDELVHLSLNPLSSSLNRAYARSVNKRICQGNYFLCH